MIIITSVVLLLTEPSNTKVLSRSAAIQSLQRRLDALRGNQLPDTQGSFKSGIGFQTPSRDKALNDKLIRQARKETPNTSVKITVKRTSTTSGKDNASTGHTQSLLTKSSDRFGASSLLNKVPRSPSIFQASPVVRAQPPPRPSPSAVAKALPTANIASVRGATVLGSASTVAAASNMQNHISDMMDTRMDMMSDMAEAGMFGGGMMGVGGLNALGGLGSMGMMGGLGMGGMGGGLMGGGLGGIMGGGLGGLGMMAAFS